MDLNQELTSLQNDLKGYVSKAAEEKAQHGTMLSETKAALEKIQTQVDAIDMKLVNRHTGEKQVSLADQLKDNDDVQRLLRSKKGTASFTVKGANPFSTKTTITEIATGSGLGPVGDSTSGVLGIDRISGITPEARQALRVRDLLVSRPTTLQLVDFVKVSSAPAAGSMTLEANAITENAVSFTSASEKVQTVATWIPATRQVLDDMTDLMGYISTSLPYYIDLEEELQLLSGDATGANLHGLITQAAAATYTTLSTDNRIDILGQAISQIATAKELDPTFIALNTADWWNIRLTKDSYGRYILGDPQSPVAPNLFGIPVVPTTSITANHYLIGSGAAPAAEIRDRMETTVEISTEHASFFTQGLVAIRAEKRLALVVKRPNAFVTGVLTIPPAS
jgi:HK97 family phage major capsid protein